MHWGSRFEVITQVLREKSGEKREGKESILGSEPQHFGIGSCSRLVEVRRE